MGKLKPEEIKQEEPADVVGWLREVRKGQEGLGLRLTALEVGILERMERKLDAFAEFLIDYTRPVIPADTGNPIVDGVLAKMRQEKPGDGSYRNEAGDICSRWTKPQDL